MNQRLRDAYNWQHAPGVPANRISNRIRIVNTAIALVIDTVISTITNTVTNTVRRYRLHRIFSAGLMVMVFYAPALASSLAAPAASSGLAAPAASSAVAANLQNVNVQTLYTNADELQGYQLGDFDGDGVTDIFRINGTQWQYAPGGVGAWRNLATDSTPLGNLRFGDFNGDGYTDLFRLTPAGATNQWQVSYGGRTAWVNLASDPRPLTELRLGDFDGDGRTDIFSLNAGGQWIFSAGGVDGWRNLAAEPATPLADLRFGDFDGDGITDVFRAVWTGATYQWQYSSGGISSWQNLASDPTPIGDLRLADFDGDGFTDIFRSAGNQWQYAPGARLGWVNLAADSSPLADLRFGDFDGDGMSDVFNVAGGQLRYSAGGVRSWLALVPGSRSIYDLRFGDFNNDNVTDVFRAVWTGTTYQWQFSPGGVGAWENLASDPTPIDLLRFGDFDGDGFTDVFRVIDAGGTNQWQFSARARDPWQNLATDPALLSELRFGDFNGDGRTDVFSVARQTDGSGDFTTYQWRYAPSGTGGWQNLAADPTPLSELRFGFFDANATTDVFSQLRTGATYNDATYQWRYSAAGTSGWQNLAADPLNLTGLRFADLDGNGIDDVFSVVRQPSTYQWRYSPDARSGWQNLASDPTPLSELRFGDFNGDGREDVFSVAGDGRWRYSAGGTSAWNLLGPPTDVTPTPTLTPTPTTTTYPPTPTFTPTPTGQVPPPSPSCNNILVNGDFEQNSAWTFGNSPIPGKYTSIQRRSGNRAVQLGNPPDAGHGATLSYSSIRQAVSVPHNATSVQLRWWHYYQSAQGTNPNPGSNHDRQEVILLTPQGNTLQILSRVLRNDNAWQQSVIDLTEFAGQSFYVYFNVYNDGNGARTWMYLDDVEVAVCGGKGGDYGGGHGGGYGGGQGGSYGGGQSGGQGGGGQGGYQPPGYQPPYQGPPANYRPPSGYRPQPYKPGMGGGGYPHPTGEPAPSATPGSDADPETVEAFVVSVITGDTIMVRIDGVEYTVRYLGIDAPELNEDFGEESAGLNEFLVAGNIVYLERDTSDTDRFGRLLRYVFLDDGTFVNLELVRMGLARAVDSAPDTRYLADLLQAEIDAREEGVGIWSGMASGAMNGAGSENGMESGMDNGGESAAVALAPMPDTMSATPTPAAPVAAASSAPETAEAGGTGNSFVPAGGDDSLQIPAAPVAQASTEASAEASAQPTAQADAQAPAAALDGALPIPGAELPGTEPGAIAGEVPFVEPDQCIELVNNGAFEAPDTGWTLLPGAITPAYTNERVFNDSRYAMQVGIVDGVNRAGVSAIEQLINLPESADSIVLSFRYLPVYGGQPGPGDLQYVDIYNGLTGQFAGRVLSEQRHAETWLPVNYDLTQLAGQPVRLVFAVNNDGVTGTIGMYVDFVSIWACNLAHLTTPDGNDPDSGGSDSDDPDSDNNAELASPTLDSTPAADGQPQSETLPGSGDGNNGENTNSNDDNGPEPSSSLSNQDAPGQLRGLADRAGTILAMAGIFGAIALVTIVAVGVRSANRS